VGLGVGVWGLGVWGLAPTPKPPIPNPQSPIPILKYFIFFEIIFNYFSNINKIKIYIFYNCFRYLLFLEDKFSNILISGSEAKICIGIIDNIFLALYISIFIYFIFGTQ